MNFYDVKNIYINEISLLKKDVILVEPMYRIKSFEIIDLNKEYYRKIYKYTSLYNLCNVSYYDLNNNFLKDTLFYVDKKNNKENRYFSTVKIINGIRLDEFCKPSEEFINNENIFYYTNEYIKQKRLK